MKVLITGGGGFIGVSLAEKFVKKHQVVLLDRNFKDNTYDFSSLKNNKNVSLIEADILDSAKLTQAAKDAQIIIHTAAIVGVQEVLNNSLYTLDVNYMGTSNVLKAASQNPDLKRVVCFSTSEVFGASAFSVAEDGDAILHSVQDVRWSYCISKLADEQLAMSYYRQRGLPVVVVRPFNIFGPKRVGDHVVIRFILRALKNEDLEVYGDGTQVRAWCYIDDFCQALLRCTEKEEATGQAFNIGNPRNTLTIYELAKKVISLSGSKSKIAFKPIDFMDVEIRVPNITKMKKMLGFTPEVELEDGLSRTIDWVKENEEKITRQISARKKNYNAQKQANDARK